MSRVSLVHVNGRLLWTETKGGTDKSFTGILVSSTLTISLRVALTNQIPNTD